MNIAAVRPSTYWPASSRKIPLFRKKTEWPAGGPPWTKWKSTPMAMTKLAPTARIPMGAPPPGVRVPKKTIRKNAIAGRAGISQAWWITPASPFQEVDLVDVDRLAVAIDEDDDGQTDADFRRGH